MLNCGFETHTIIFKTWSLYTHGSKGCWCWEGPAHSSSWGSEKKKRSSERLSVALRPHSLAELWPVLSHSTLVSTDTVLSSRQLSDHSKANIPSLSAAPPHRGCPDFRSHHKKLGSSAASWELASGCRRKALQLWTWYQEACSCQSQVNAGLIYVLHREGEDNRIKEQEKPMGPHPFPSNSSQTKGSPDLPAGQGLSQPLRASKPIGKGCSFWFFSLQASFPNTQLLISLCKKQKGSPLLNPPIKNTLYRSL